ncbi:MAG TPA: sugar ABC transporter substrate-binding protein [Lachnospiraceae bacterium]
MKGQWAGLMVASLAAFMFVGCGGNTPQNQDAKNETKQESNLDTKGATIKFWHYMSNDKEGKFVQKAVEEFNASQNEIVVEAQYIPRDELMKQYTIGVVSGELPDVGMVDNPDHNSYAAMGVFEDITKLYEESGDKNFNEGSIASCYYDGKLYGLPWNNNCLGLFYNTTMLEEAGVTVPTTWSELLVACEKLTKDGTYGLGISAINNEEGTFQYMPWLLSAGGSVDKLDSKESKESMSYLKNLLDKGYISSECVNWTQADVEKQFASGKCAMMINGPWQFDGLSSDAPDLKYGVAQVPKADNGNYASVLGGENLGICTGANVEAAWKFVSWIESKEKSGKLCQEMGRLSPRTDIDAEALYEGDSNWKIFAEIIPNSYSRGPSVDWPKISQAIYTAQQEVFTGQQEVELAMDEAASSVSGLNMGGK